MMMGTIYLVIASVIWGLAHSYLASHQVKRMVRKLFGVPAYERLYRFGYNVFALASFFPLISMLANFPDRLLYQIPSPWVYLTTIVQGLAVFGLLSAVMHTGPLEFAGLAQFASTYAEAAPARLVTDGLYAYVRHPLYTASLVFIWLSPEMTLNRLVLWSVFSIYILVGAYFEERKLVSDFGAEYLEYRSRTPMLIPGLSKLFTHKP
jgi:protein-S-isoprenylcysteine O-methyltransferase Ste14